MSAAAPEQLTLNLEGWEGPLDLLLDLARRQRIDLSRISILGLVDQYLAHVGEARALPLETAADWLVMAAWLAYLKSALLLPSNPAPEPEAEELAARLKHRLARLEAMREAADALGRQPRLGREVFGRGAPEGLRTTRRVAPEASLYELMAAYGAVCARGERRVHRIEPRPVMALDDALRRLKAMLGVASGWRELGAFLPASADPRYRRSALASMLGAALELTRVGAAELRQRAVFAPVEVRAR